VSYERTGGRDRRFRGVNEPGAGVTHFVVQTSLGIDLASQPANTAMCVIAWYPGRASVRVLARSTWNGTSLHDKLLSSSVQGIWGTGDDEGWGDTGRPTRVAIDAPFGWPDPFVHALTTHHGGGPWPETLDNSRAPFERRATDRFVKERTGKQPLSVSTDRIAYPGDALRGAARRPQSALQVRIAGA
jgi:hypothetical protein